MQRSHFGLNRALLLVTLLSVVSAAGLAQESRGSITGKVIDAQNAVGPNATVVVTNNATNVSSRVTTNQTGYYEVDFLVPGSYTVSGEITGFKKLVRSGITLDTGDRLAVDLQLHVCRELCCG